MRGRSLVFETGLDNFDGGLTLGPYKRALLSLVEP
jgi:hypothetical protein